MTRFKSEARFERRLVVSFFLTGILAGGCDISHVVGNLDGGQGGAAGTGGQAGRMAPIIDAGFPGDVSMLGASESWTGYVENYQLPSGSDVLNLSFAFDPTGVVVGRVKFGTAPPLAPPTDPNVGYPLGLNLLTPPDRYPSEGFAYTMASGSLVGTRLRFMIWLPEFWSAWCALQTPVPGSYTCVPNWELMTSADGSSCSQLNPTSNQFVSIDCGKLALCTGLICACSSSSCAASFNTASVQFDVALSVAGANGSITGQIGDHNVRLTQDP